MGPSTLLVLFAGTGFLEGTVINRYFKERANCNIGSPQAIILNAAPEVSGCVGYFTQPAHGMYGNRSFKEEELQENTCFSLGYDRANWKGVAVGTWNNHTDLKPNFVFDNSGNTAWASSSAGLEWIQVDFSTTITVGDRN